MSLLSIERRDRGRFVLLTVVGVALVAGSAAVQARAEDMSWFAVALLTVGLLALFGGVPNAIAAHLHLDRARALREGREVIARWTVTPAAWSRFVASDQVERNGRPWPNQLLKPAQAPMQGMEIIIARQAILVGDDLHLLPHLTWPKVEVLAGDPVRLNFVTPMEEPVGGLDEESLRLPVGIGQTEAVGAVRRSFNGDRDPA